MRSLRLVVAAATYPYRGLLQRAVRGQPEVVAQTTRIGFAYASFGASLCVFYLLYLGASGVLGALPALTAAVLLDVGAIALFSLGQRRSPHLLVIASAALTTFYFHFAIGPAFHVGDLAFAQVVYPFIVLGRGARPWLVASGLVWAVVIACIQWLELPGLLLPTPEGVASLVAPQLVVSTFAFAIVQMWFFERERARARDAVAAALEATEFGEREAAKRYESTLSTLAARDDVERRLLEAARRAGMSHVTDRALHGLTAALNAFGASRAALKTSLEGLRAEKLPRVTRMLAATLAAGQLPRYSRVADYLEQLAQHWQLAIDAASAELRQIEDASARVTRTISVQQGAARFRSEQQTVELEDLVARAVELAAAEASGWRLDVERAPVTCDASLVREVLLVLMTNASEAVAEQRARATSPRSSRGSSQSAATSRPSPPRVSVRAGLEGGALHVEIEDAGCGFAPGFNPFEAGRSTKGANRGFGLHWAANSIHAARGTITLESDGPGRGARARFVLPLGEGAKRCAA